MNQIEAEGKRTREVHWGPRTLDIDIVLYNDEIIQRPDLMIPHMKCKRLFVWNR
ncbi:MAG: 2-amino-4-hydroxy-6-hydroxymethyldihydropteridine diphosphokinase [Eubacterium ventriosum]